MEAFLIFWGIVFAAYILWVIANLREDDDNE